MGQINKARFKIPIERTEKYNKNMLWNLIANSLFQCNGKENSKKKGRKHCLPTIKKKKILLIIVE